MVRIHVPRNCDLPLEGAETVTNDRLIGALLFALSVIVMSYLLSIHRRYSAPYYVCQSQPGGGIIVEASDPRNVGERCDI